MSVLEAVRGTDAERDILKLVDDWIVDAAASFYSEGPGATGKHVLIDMFYDGDLQMAILSHNTQEDTLLLVLLSMTVKAAKQFKLEALLDENSANEVQAFCLTTENSARFAKHLSAHVNGELVPFSTPVRGEFGSSG